MSALRPLGLGPFGQLFEVAEIVMTPECFSVPDWRTPSIIELWLSASDRITPPDINRAIVAIPVWFET